MNNGVFQLIIYMNLSLIMVSFQEIFESLRLYVYPCK